MVSKDPRQDNWTKKIFKQKVSILENGYLKTIKGSLKNKETLENMTAAMTVEYLCILRLALFSKL